MYSIFYDLSCLGSAGVRMWRTLFERTTIKGGEVFADFTILGIRPDKPMGI
jgi:hypothetical protein